MKIFIFVPLFLSIVKPVHANQIVQYVNNYRASIGESQLIENKKLDKSAMAKACDMVNRHYWSHQDPQGKWSWHYFVEAGYTYGYMGEDMARNYGNDYKGTVIAWFNSPTHKKVMLNPVYKDIGIGQCGIYTVAHFGGQK